MSRYEQLFLKSRDLKNDLPVLLALYVLSDECVLAAFVVVGVTMSCDVLPRAGTPRT